MFFSLTRCQHGLSHHAILSIHLSPLDLQMHSPPWCSSCAAPTLNGNHHFLHMVAPASLRVLGVDQRGQVRTSIHQTVHSRCQTGASSEKKKNKKEKKMKHPNFLLFAFLFIFFFLHLYPPYPLAPIWTRVAYALRSPYCDHLGGYNTTSISPANHKILLDQATKLYVLLAPIFWSVALITGSLAWKKIQYNSLHLLPSSHHRLWSSRLSSVVCDGFFTAHTTAQKKIKSKNLNTLVTRR